MSAALVDVLVGSLMLLLAACESFLTPTATPTRAFTATPSPTTTRAPSATSTFIAPTQTPTATSVPLTATPTPAKIEPGNVAQVHLLASWPSPNKSWVKQVVWSPDGRTIASLENQKAVLWEFPSGRVRRIVDGPSYSLSLSPDGRWLAAGVDNSFVKLWEVSSGSEVRNLGQHSSAVRTLSFSPDSRLLFAGSTYGPQKLWEVATGRLTGDLDGQVSGVVTSAAFSPNGKLLAVGTGGSRGGDIELWDVAKIEPVASLFDWRDDKYTVAFSPDGQRLASGSLNGNVKLWDIATGQTVSTLTLQRTSINSVAFSPGGELIAVATGDGVRLAQLPSLRELRLPTGFAGDVSSVAFSPDGQILATGSQDGTVKLWGLQP